jgi:membrane protein YqaA with SNARE-associated domain
LWANPTERARFRAGAALVVLGAATVGGLVGYMVGKHKTKRRNPKRRRRR